MPPCRKHIILFYWTAPKIRSLFLPGTGDLPFTGFIFIWQNILQGITFQRWSNPDSEEYSYRDYFMVMESIFIRQDLRSGIIFIGEKHLNLEECSYKDAFVVEK